jgi:hypothetical protein
MKTSNRLVEKTGFVQLDDLKPHEKVDAHRVACLKIQIETDGILKKAIAVDAHTNVILDGHHRLTSLRQIGCKRIPVTFVDYSSPLIKVTPWNGLELTKSEIVHAGLNRMLFPPKTSKHMVKLGNKTVHISEIEERVNVPLSKLKRV